MSLYILLDIWSKCPKVIFFVELINFIGKNENHEKTSKNCNFWTSLSGREKLLSLHRNNEIVCKLSDFQHCPYYEPGTVIDC